MGSFLTLNDFEFDCIAFLQTLVSIGRDGTVVNEHIGATIASDEPISFCVVKPLDRTFQSLHVRPLSQASFTRTRSKSSKDPACPVNAHILGCVRTTVKDLSHLGGAYFRDTFPDW